VTIDRQTEPRTLAVVLFERFELLDVYGPLEMFGMLPDHFRIQMLGPTSEPVPTAPGPRTHVDYAYTDAPPADVVLVPGGRGTRPLAEAAAFLDWLRAYTTPAEYVTSVCTGSALLAAAGLLDGYRATSNKRAFAWVREQSAAVEWVPQARWVADRNRWTSSGVAAGIDMALAFIAHLHGEELALDVADGAEYEWHRDASWDPFAAKNGLV
jgi:transcriptional regulator GlxA family with amidase domain